MKQKIIIAIIIAAILFLGFYKVSGGESIVYVDKEVALPVPETIPEWIHYYAVFYKLSPAMEKEYKNDVWCESNNRVHVFGDGGKAFGPGQFHKPTFDRWKVEMGEPTLDYYNFQHQLKVMAWAYAKGESYRDDWTCYTM